MFIKELQAFSGTSTGCSEIINNAAIILFVAEPIQQEVNETAFLYFHISLFACYHNTRSPASDYIRCIRTRVFKMQTPDMLKIPEGGLIHFLLYWLHYKKY